MKKTIIRLSLMIILACFFQSINLAQENELEHSVIKPIPGSTIMERQSKFENQSTMSIMIPVDGKNMKVDKHGQYWELRYEFLDENGKRNKKFGTDEVLNNYKAAVLEKGGEVLNSRSNTMIFSVPRQSGGTTWLYVQGYPGSYLLKIIDEKGFEGILSFGAEELKLALDAEGRVAIYGINFDVDKADLKLGAEKIISEIVKLIKLNPDLKLEVQGHTDNTGSAQHNLTLSGKRAETVKNFIMLYGISASRLTAKGYGMNNPIESNDTEEGRAKNRRVELVKN